MVRRLLALVVLVNAVAVVPNLPSILASVDGETLGRQVGEWSIGIGTSAGDLAREISAGTPSGADVVALQEQLRADPGLAAPSDDPNVAELLAVWDVLRQAGETADTDALADDLVAEARADADVSEELSRLLAEDVLDVQAVADLLGVDPVLLEALLGLGGTATTEPGPTTAP